MGGERDPWVIEGLEPASEQQWRASVDAVLSRRRGDLSRDELDRLFEKVLTTRTDDGIVLQPLYRAEDAPVDPGLPGQSPFVRAGTATGVAPSGWDVRQRVTVSSTPEQANAVVLDALSQGATSVWLDLDGLAPGTDLLDAVLTGVYLELVPVVLAPGPAATEAATAMLELWRRRDLSADDVRGSLGFDPLGRFATSGGVEDAGIGLAAAADMALATHAAFPHVSTLVADGSRYHDAGAGEVDELALALATSTEYLRTLQTAGLTVDDALAQIDVRLAATDNQFLTIAKLRAARRLFARVAEVAGASPDAAAQRQHAVSSLPMLTRYDPWVNLLRTTVAGFAAGVAGADAVTIEPHDLRLREASDIGTLGPRLARNVSTILIDEAHVARVIDPAGGSWFVERLTEQLANAAWARFQQIERVGLVSALQQGLPQHWLAETRAARAERVAHRRQPITGVTEFPNLADSPPPESSASGLPVGPTPFEPVSVHFYAEEVESLRDRSAAHAQATGSPPRVFLACLGPLAEHTARATFTTNLFAAGGIAAVSAGTVTVDDVTDRFADSGAQLACICGSDTRYAAEAVTVARALADAGAARVYLAGNPGELRAELDAAGVAEYVVAGGDAVGLLDRALSTVGVQ